MEKGNKVNKSQLKKLFARSEVTVIAAVLALGIIFTAFSDSFFTAYNLFNMGRTAAIYIFIAIGQALVVIVGGMNLSLGYIGGMTVVAAGYSMQVLGLPPVAAVLAGLAVGVAAGCINGIIITTLKLNSFVVTLATSFIFGKRRFPWDSVSSLDGSDRLNSTGIFLQIYSDRAPYLVYRRKCGGGKDVRCQF